MKKSVISGAIVVIIAAAASAPYFCGNSIEKRINSETQQINASLQSNGPKYSYKITDYNKGWLDATAKSQLIIENQEFDINSTIKHGPYSYFGLGTIESTLSSTTLKELNDLFDNKPILTSITHLGFSDKSSTTINLAEINNKTHGRTTVNWKGAVINADVNNNKLIGDVKAPLLSIKDSQATFIIENLTMNFDSAYAPTPAEYKNINWSGKSLFNIDKISFNKDNEAASAKINLISDVKDEKSLIAYDMQLKISDIKLPESAKKDVDLDINSFNFNLGFSGIPKDALVNFYSAVYELQSKGKAIPESELAKLGSDLGVAYLQGIPSINFDTTLLTTQGDIGLKAEAKLVKPDTNSDLMMLGIAAVTRLEVSITPSFSERLIDNAIAQGKIPQTKEEVVAMLTQKNRLTLNNGVFSGTFEFKNGKFYSNGQPDPELQQLLMSMSRMF